MKSKKLLSVILALIMILSVTTVCRAENVATATVTVTAQAYGNFVAAYINMEVRGDAAENYDLADTVDKSTGVSAADVFVTLHEKMFEGELTKENAKTTYFDYDESGYISRLFGEATSSNSFIHNGGFPNNAGEATTVTTQKVTTGDTLEFFIYQDASYWYDAISWLNKNNTAVTELTVAPSDDITLSVSSASFIYAASAYKDADSLHTAYANSTVSGAQLGYVDIETLEITPIEKTGSNGKASFKAPAEEGTYYLTAYVTAEDIESGKTPLVMSLTKLTVDKNAPQDTVDPCALSSLFVKSFVSSPDVLPLSPSFNKSVTAYTSAVSDYPVDFDYPVWRSAYVKATAESSTSVITASCNGVNVTVGNDWTILNSALIGGKNNILTVKVAESAEENAASRTYTVVIPMKPKANTLPTPVTATATQTVALGNSYTADLSKIFIDPDEIDTVTYKVSVDGAQSVAASKNYSFTPSELGDYTLVFTANDGSADDSTAYTLTLKVVQGSDQAFILTAQTESGDWYPTVFDKNKADYAVCGSQSENKLSFTVSEYASVKIGNSLQSPDENGVYTAVLGSDKVDITVTSSDESTVKAYSFTPILKKAGYPDKVVDFLSVNSQYTNGIGNGNADKPWVSLGGEYTSLGNFGGYITYYYKDGITDNPNNKYGIDFYVYGNAKKDDSTSTKTAFFEPAQAWVSEDGAIWYALAGSAHYDEGVDRNYSVTYTKTTDGKTAWTDNRGNSCEGGEFAGAYPSADIYTMNSLSSGNSFTLSGIALPAQNGKIATVGEATDAYPVRWGYGDCFANGVLGTDVNPYTDNSNFDLETNGFDLKWAVDQNGIPVDVTGKEFHYVKLVSASNIWHSILGEKSPEISGVLKSSPQAEAVGTTAAPDGVTLSDGTDEIVVNFNANERIYNVNVGNMKYLSISVNGASDGDNIYINNTRIAADGCVEGFKVTKQSGEKLVRVLVQNGDREPLIYILKITGTANASEDLIESVKLDVNGSSRTCTTKDGTNYSASVGYRISSVKINPVADSSVDITVNGAPLADSYTLETGKNTFTVVGTSGNVIHTVTLVITKDSAPASSGKITVYFTLMGDKAHGSGGEVHTFENGGLTTWISKTAVTVDTPATVLDVIEKALDGKYTFVNESGNYISEIGDLGVFDNGSLSGWMYTLNGTHPGKGIAEQTVKQGDKIVLHYTDDYTLEESKMSSTGSATATSKTDSVKNDTVISGDTATVTVDEKNVSTAIFEALKNPSADNAVTISASNTKSATTVSVELSASSIKEISSNNLAAEIETDCGKVVIDAAALKAIAQQGDEKIIITVTLRNLENSSEADEQAVVADVKITCGGKNITSFGNGTITVKIPVDESFSADNFYKAFIISEDGSQETTYGKCVSENGKLFVKVTSSHLSTFVVTDVLTAPFKDVVEHSLAEGIRYVYKNNIMQGVGKETFAPDEYMTRAQLVTVLYRTEKAEKPLNSDKFTDVPQNEWYSEAVMWAENEGIVKGVSETEFAPDENVTREQFALILMRFAEFKGFDTSVSAELDAFEDSQNISPWAEQAFAWAYGSKLIMGIGENFSEPLGNATRAQVAAILMRFCNAYAM